MTTIERLVEVTVSADLAELVSDRMWGWGVRGVAEETLPDGRVRLRTSVGNDDAAVERSIASLDPTWAARIVEVDATAAEDWKRFAEPVRVRPDLVVAPSWCDVTPHATDETVIRIDPGGAFGLGDHPTTASSLHLLADELDHRHETARATASLLDVGCGTGALAILAALRGVPGVRAIDIADAAVAATRENATRNGVGDRIDTDTTPLADVARPDGGFDLIVANILAPVLVSMAPDLRRLLATDGTLIISGILAAGHGHGHGHVLDALAPLVPATTSETGGWATIALRASP